MKSISFFYEKLPFVPSRQPIKFSDLDKIPMKRRGLRNNRVRKNFFFFFQISPLRQQKLPFSTFRQWKL